MFDELKKQEVWGVTADVVVCIEGDYYDDYIAEPHLFAEKENAVAYAIHLEEMTGKEYCVTRFEVWS